MCLVLEICLYNNGVYFAGETIDCIITLQNRANPRPQKNTKNTRLKNEIPPIKSSFRTISAEKSDSGVKCPHCNESTISIGWATVQLFGYFSVNTDILKEDAFLHLVQSSPNDYPSPTSLPDLMPRKNDHMFPIILTSPAICACDVDLLFGQEVKYRAQCRLPIFLPPSHLGHGISIHYRVVVGIQRRCDVTQLCRLPIRILNSFGDKLSLLKVPLLIQPSDCWIFTNESDDSLPLNSSRSLMLKNKVLLLNPGASETLASRCFQLIASSMNGACNVVLSVRDDRLCKVMLSRSILQYKDTLFVVIDVESSPHNILHYSVFLEQIEKFSDTVQLKSNGNTPAGITRRVVGSRHGYMLDQKYVQLHFQCPSSFSPSFSTDTFELSYQIRVQLILPAKNSKYSSILEENYVNGIKTQIRPPMVNVEIVQCEIPFILLPSTANYEQHITHFDL